MSQKRKSFRLGIAIPTYNEAQNIAQVVTAVKRAVTQADITACTLLIIDDGSPDGTGKIADKLARTETTKHFTVQVLHRNKKAGLGAAYVAGFQELLKQDHSHILQMDADLSHNPAYIPTLVQAARDNDLVVGSRYVPIGATPDWPLHRRLVSRLGNLYVSTWLGKRLHDYTGGFNVYSSELLRRIELANLRSPGYSFQMELKYLALRLTSKAIEVPITFIDRKHGTSKIPKNTIVNSLLLPPALRLKNSKKIVHFRTLVNNRVIIELVLLLIVAAGFFIEMAHIATTPWLNVFLKEHDSLTLPVLWQSLIHHEPLHWAMSAQLNLFPEGVLFVPVALLVKSVAGQLFWSAFVNLLVFYGLVRLFLKSVATVPLSQRRVYGLLTMFCLLGMMLLETPTTFGQAFPTYMLFTTYYDGPLFVGMINLCFFASQIRHGWQLRLNEPKTRLLLAGLFLMNTFAVASNALYFIQFTVPILASLLLYQRIVKSRLPRPAQYSLLIVQVMPVIVGLLLDYSLLSGLMTVKANSHLAKIGTEADSNGVLYGLVSKAFSPIAATLVTRIRILISMLLYFSVLFVLLFSLRKHPKLVQKGSTVFVALFIVLQPILLALALYFSNGAAERYFIAPTILVLLAIPLFATTRIAAPRYTHATWLALALSCAVLVLCPLRLPKLSAFKQSPNADEACLDRSLGGRPANGLAYYLVSAQLDAYNTHHQRVLQMDYYLPPAIYAWLNNAGAYYGKTFTFYVLERNPDLTPLIGYYEPLPPQGQTSISTCPNFYVYHYAPGSPGYRALNKNIQSSIQAYEHHHSRAF